MEPIAYLGYPSPVDIRSGCKVGWYYYKDEKDAKKAAKKAKSEAARMSCQGYDFGFMCPGTITFMRIEGPHHGMWEVCVP